MNFSEFAQLLYPYKGFGKTQADFLVDLVCKIMAEPILAEDKKLDSSGEYNPLNALESNSLCKIYSGSRPLSKKAAAKILDHLDGERFKSFIEDTPDETQRLMETSLTQKGVDVPDGRVSSICADLFVSILNDCANKKRNYQQKVSADQESRVVQESNLSSDSQTDIAFSTAETSVNVTAVENSTDPKASSEQLHELFLGFACEYTIMDIINRKPAELNWDDLADLNNFLKSVDEILSYYSSCDGLLRTSIKSFADTLLPKALSLEAELSKRVGFENKTGTVNMEDDYIDDGGDEDNEDDYDDDDDDYDDDEWEPDIAYLCELMIEDWGSFRIKINSLFEHIRLWSNKTATM